MDNQPAPVNPTSAAPAAELPAVPTSWPGAFGIYKYSKATVKVNLGSLLGLVATSIVASLVLSAVMNAVKVPKPVGQLVTDLISGFFGFGAIFVLLGGVHRAKVSFGEACKKASAMYLKAILLYVLYVIAAFVSLLLLIIPFFFVMPRLVLSFYFLADKNMSPMEALKASWNQTKGNVGKIYGIIGASILMVLLMITVIGIPFAIYFLFMYSAAYALVYSFITSHAAAPAAAPVQAPSADTAAPTQPQ